MSHLLLVRHGQSEWNAVGRWQGQANPPLSDLGRKQATVAADSLQFFDAICASPLLRAFDTAEIIADILGIAPVLIDNDLMERDAGPWQGLTRPEIRKNWPNHLETGRRPEGFETDKSLLKRVRKALTYFTSFVGASGQGLVITHGGVIGALESAYGEPWERIGNLSGRWIDLLDGSMTIGHRVDLLTDTTTPELF